MSEINFVVRIKEKQTLLGLDGIGESLHTNARIVVMWNSILRSREMNAKLQYPTPLIFLTFGKPHFCLHEMQG
jgi:hypothetical protein